jgi:hypothetical protein
MHVGRDRPSDADVLGSGCNGKEETAGQNVIENLGKTDAGLALEDACSRIEGEDPIQRLAQYDAPGLVERGIAIAATFAPGDQIGLGSVANDVLELAGVAGAIELAFLKWMEAPPRERGPREGRRIYHVAAAATVARISAPDR